jgi:hypothetical protein
MEYVIEAGDCLPSPIPRILTEPIAASEQCKFQAQNMPTQTLQLPAGNGPAANQFASKNRDEPSIARLLSADFPNENPTVALTSLTET